MSDTPWTPGPWGAQHQPRLSIINGDNGEHIADTGCWRDDEHPEMRANARLIAAAPELAEALAALHQEANRIGAFLSARGQGATVLGMRCMAAERALRAAGHPDYQEGGE